MFRGDYDADDPNHELDPAVAKEIKSKQAAASMLKRKINASRNQELKQLLVDGFGMHNAGMLRKDRNLAEQLFEAGIIRCLCCTATLAWGVNLPAQCVIIKVRSRVAWSALSVVCADRLFAACDAELTAPLGIDICCLRLQGTELYNAEKGGFTELDVLDVLQIFGRAGRPQYNKPGLGIIITQHSQLDRHATLQSTLATLPSYHCNY